MHLSTISYSSKGVEQSDLIPHVPAPAQVTLTLDQVKGIVEKAVQEREQELRIEFSNILATKLQEQYNQFAKFNQDFLHRRMEASPFNCTD